MAVGTTPGTTTTTYPDWWSQTDGTGALANLGNAVSGFVGPEGQIENVYNNWYSNDNNLTAPWSAEGHSNLEQAYNNTATGAAWSPYVTSGANMVQNSAQWNADTQAQFLNPYRTNVVDEMTRLSNQNLFESVLPGVNSTFTGAGQFGSARNADFNNRAIRDQQNTLTGNIGNVLYNAQNQAAAQYSDWANKGMTAGVNLGNLATTGANLSQQDFNNLNTTGTAYQNWQQGQFDRSKADWLQQANYPLQQYGALAQIYGNLKNGLPTSTTFEATPESGLTDSQKVAALVAMTAALNQGGANGSNSTLTNLFNSITGAASGAWDWLTGGSS